MSAAKAKAFRRRFGGCAEAFQRQNKTCAEIILRNASPGDDSLAIRWAKQVLGRGQHGTDEQLPSMPGPANTRE